jgi:hypothetical protein
VRYILQFIPPSPFLFDPFELPSTMSTISLSDRDAMRMSWVIEDLFNRIHELDVSDVEKHACVNQLQTVLLASLSDPQAPLTFAVSDAEFVGAVRETIQEFHEMLDRYNDAGNRKDRGIEQLQELIDNSYTDAWLMIPSPATVTEQQTNDQ